MSIKIHRAYRIRKGYDYWDVLQDVRIRALKEAKKVLRSTYANLVEQWKDPAYAEECAKIVYDDGPSAGYRPTEWGTMAASDYVRRSYRKQLTSGLRNLFDLDVSVTVHRANKRYLLIPYAGSGLLWRTLSFMDLMPALEDYHYQDAADAPYDYDPKSKITPKMWHERRRVWTRLVSDREWARTLVLDIVSFSGFSNVCPAFEDLIARAKKEDKGT